MEPQGLKATDPKDSQISKEFSIMDNAIEELLEVVEKVAEKLTPVLRDPSEKLEGVPVGPGDERPVMAKTPETSLCGVAEAIRKPRKAIKKATSQLRSVLRRIEL